MTCHYGAQLSAGRVQTPTLALIVRREEEIKRFVPKDYYMVQADLGKFFVTWQDGKGQTAIFDKAKAEALAEKIKGKEFRGLRREGRRQSHPAAHAVRSDRAAARCQQAVPDVGQGHPVGHAAAV